MTAELYSVSISQHVWLKMNFECEYICVQWCEVLLSPGTLFFFF